MSSRHIFAAVFVVVPLAGLVLILIMTRTTRHDAHQKLALTNSTIAIRTEAPLYATHTRTSRLDLTDVAIPPIGQRAYVADTVVADSAFLKKTIMAYDHTEGRNMSAYEAAEKLLFAHTNKLSLTEVYQRLFSVCVTGETSSAHHDALIALRFKAVIPIARDTIATWQPGDHWRIAHKARDILHRLEHPDSLQAMIWLDNEIADSSELRQGEQKTWWGGLPLTVFYRDDCLDVLVDVVSHPADHKMVMWRACLHDIQYFTTDVAMVTFKQGFETMKDWKKYWPDNDPEYEEARAKYKIAQQEARRAGKEPITHRRPKPLLDE